MYEYRSCLHCTKVSVMLSSTSYSYVLTPVKACSNWLMNWLIGWLIGWLIDWLIGPQKLFFTFSNQVNLGHATTQSCELPKRPILHIKSHKEQVQENKTTALRKKIAQSLLASIFDTLQLKPGIAWPDTGKKDFSKKYPPAVNPWPWPRTITHLYGIPAN